MKLIEVKSTKDKKRFLDVARIIYKDDPAFVCPLDSQIEDVFDPEKNVFAREGHFCRWYMEDEKGALIGRVAAFINKRKAWVYEKPTGGMGFFECINNKKAAFMLFDCCMEWLKERGMKAMLGPINLGENDKFWGLLVENYDTPAFGMAYNKDYYQSFFTEYGFNVHFEQLTNRLILNKKYPERFYKIAEWLLKKPGYTYAHFTYKNKQKYIRDFVEIYNDAWSSHNNFTPVTSEDIEEQLMEAKPFLVEEFVWFAYYNDEPVSLYVMLPDINYILRYFNGKMNLLNKIRFICLVKKRIIQRARIVVMGVKKKYQNHGIESGFFWHLEKVMEKYPEYKEIEMSWVGDFNERMLALHHALGGTPSKKHITYIKNF